MPAPREITIGALAAETGAHLETIRYYERVGVLPAPPRSAAGRRLYGGEHVARLRFVRRARELGFTLDEVRRLLALAEGGGRSCEEVEALAREHLARVREKIADLRRMEETLAHTADRCSAGVASCPIIEALDGRNETGEARGPVAVEGGQAASRTSRSRPNGTLPPDPSG
jgi:MerR family mercuric resistance operon transcriptional regulator